MQASPETVVMPPPDEAAGVVDAEGEGQTLTGVPSSSVGARGAGPSEFGALPAAHSAQLPSSTRQESRPKMSTQSYTSWPWMVMGNMQGRPSTVTG
eukprot:CAMPEP_0119119262 /NCGR_PEP_ID=MMETSP1310-20130426/826_1 /TAXON_ID=464262 /ORGANISM="Genus nov. species nov., Strain RCC2339" /LENGTH=95 /DNA_ID=CAMNT_0007108683 /DNA_START=104 /DNA_END=388 /DNA_ORIENTATION=+